ncbi:type II secretion system protein [Thiobacillus sp.]|uniref:type II secretion system protein n=1 Tax=Thiobacillus sp. TaxID=924 RepID=UPI0025E7CD86|nr:type II secretion system protein [Thiobacillus sp.]
MKRTRGFTLIELAIVLVIVTILIGGLAVPLSAQIQARRIAETKKTLEEAREAIMGYAMTHNTGGATPRPYLPCPDSDGDGLENRTGNECTKQSGWFPWVDLGTASQDAWGNRLHYAVHADLTSKTNGFHNGSAPTSDDPWNQVCSEENCPVVDVVDGVPVVLVSYGANGRGARNVNIPFGSPTPALPPGTSAKEIENLDADHRYVSRPPSKPGDAAGEFDDLVAWLPFSVLISRVCPAGGCP